MDFYNAKLVKYPNGMTRFYYYENRGIVSGYKKSPSQGKRVSCFDGQLCAFEDDVDPSAPSPGVNPSGRSLQVSLSRTVQKIYDYAHANTWDWFITFTFSPDRVDRYCYDACVSALKSWLDVTRRHNDGMKYIIVPELHKDGAFHFHGLFSGLGPSMFTHFKNGIYNLDSYGYGFTTATKVKDTVKAAGYIGKYITKELCAVSKGRKRYWVSRNCAVGKVIKLVMDLGSCLDRFLDGLYNNCDYFKGIRMPFGGDCWFYEWQPSWGISLSSFGPFISAFSG